MAGAFGGTKSSSKPVDVTPPDIAALRGDWASKLSELFSSEGGPAYDGPTNPGISPGETTGLQALSTAAYNPLRTGLLNDTLSGQFLPGQQGSNPFLQAAIEAAQGPTRTALNDTLGRQLPGVFTAAGQQIGGGLRSPNTRLGSPGSTAFDMAAARAFEGGAGALANIATDMSFKGYESERGRQQGAIPLQQADVQSMIANLQAQGLPRLIERLGVEDAMKLFGERTTNLLRALQVATGAPLTNIGQNQTTTTSPNIVGTLLGSAGLPGLFPAPK